MWYHLQKTKLGPHLQADSQNTRRLQSCFPKLSISTTEATASLRNLVQPLLPVQSMEEFPFPSPVTRHHTSRRSQVQDHSSCTHPQNLVDPKAILPLIPLQLFHYATGIIHFHMSTKSLRGKHAKYTLKTVFLYSNFPQYVMKS